MNRIYALLATLLVASCAANNGVTNLQSQGNLEAPQPSECVSIGQLNSDQNPADIFVGMKKCLDNENYQTAAEMYFAAMSYGIYDTKRVSDTTAHQGILVLRMNALSGLSESQLPLIQSEIDSILASNEKVCEALKIRGLPTYYPKYMIQHGIGAFTGKQSNKGLVANFNSQSAWAEAIEKSVKCKQR